jgi:antitoxin CcdA
MPAKEHISSKRSLNVTLDRELHAQAREHGYNLSAILAEAVAGKLRAEAREKWLIENQKGIDAVNKYAEENGHFSEYQRAF